MTQPSYTKQSRKKLPMVQLHPPPPCLSHLIPTRTIPRTLIANKHHRQGHTISLSCIPNSSSSNNNNTINPHTPHYPSPMGVLDPSNSHNQVTPNSTPPRITHI